MQPNYKRNIVSRYTVRDLTAIYFENFAITCVSLSPIEKKNYFGNYTDGTFIERMEGKIITKAWLEVPSQFRFCKLGKYALKENEFSGILTIDNRLSAENSKKLIPVIIGHYKERTTKLLNQYHMAHGRIFWENNYREFKIENLNDLNTALSNLNSSSEESEKRNYLYTD